MKQPNYLILGVAAFVVGTLTFTPLVRAESGSDPSGVTPATTKTEVEAENETDTNSTELNDPMHREEVAKHRAELQERIQKVKDENKVHLSEARKKVCETHQGNINQIIKKRSEQGTKYLDVFKKISDRVQAFVKEKHLTVENYDALVANINAKEAAAQAAIEANSAVTFDCATTGANKPAEVPRTTIDAVRDALKDYRTAIKDLVVKVKATVNSEVNQ